MCKEVMGSGIEIAVQAAVYAVFLILVLAGIKTDRTLPDEKEALSRLNRLRGVFALEVIAGHVVRYENCLLFPFGKFMICSVAFFFFVSGFGLAHSFKEKDNYLNLRYLLTKPVFLAIAAVITYIVYYITGIVGPVELKYVKADVLRGLYSGTNWYIKEQILFYLLFFAVYKLIKKHGWIIITAATLVVVLIFYYCGKSEAWVASAFGFPMGVLIGEKYDRLKKYIYGVPGIVTGILAAGAGLITLFIRNENIFTMVVLRNLLCIGVLLCIIALCGRVHLCYNRAAVFLTGISAQLYLFQFVWLEVSELVWEEYLIRLAFVVVMTILCAVLVSPLFKLLRDVLSGRHKKTESHP